MNTVVRYLSLCVESTVSSTCSSNSVSRFLMAQSYAGFVCFLAWASESVSHPPAKRPVALALINCIAQLGNVTGSYVFSSVITCQRKCVIENASSSYVWPSSWGPTYNISYSICIFMAVVSMAMCLIFRCHLAWLNHQSEKLEAEFGLGKGYRYTM